MNLTATIRITKIIKKTQARVFKDIKVGYVLELKYSLSGGYQSAPHINIYMNGKLVTTNNAIQLEKNLSNFEYVKII